MVCVLLKLGCGLVLPLHCNQAGQPSLYPLSPVPPSLLPLTPSLLSDDHLILKWDFKSGNTTQVVSLPKETFSTDIHWLPVGAAGSKKQSNQSDLFALACTDGQRSYYMFYAISSRSDDYHKIVM